MELEINGTNESKYGLGEYDYPSLEALGPAMQAFLISLYSLTALLAFGGNAIVVVVLTTGKRSSRELRIFLVNLALSDIIMALFSIPFTYTDFMFGQWIFHPSFCPFVQFMQHCSVIVSVYTLTAIGIDRKSKTKGGEEYASSTEDKREYNDSQEDSLHQTDEQPINTPAKWYYAIMHPLNARWTKTRGTLIVIFIWLIGLTLSSIQLVHGKAVQFTWAGKQLYDCTEEWNDVPGKVYTVGVFTVTFIFPMIILIYTYATIGWKMLRHTSPGNADPTRDHQQIQAKVKVVKMLAVVVLLFVICWLPIHILNLLLYFRKDSLAPNSDGEYYGYVATFFICHWLSMANSFVNPIIYCFMSDNFRVDLKQFPNIFKPKFGSETRPFRLTLGAYPVEAAYILDSARRRTWTIIARYII